jgi:hypothetical protein
MPGAARLDRKDAQRDGRCAVKKERNYQPMLVALVVIIIGIFIWILFKEWQDSHRLEAQQKENQTWKLKADELSQKVAELQDELKTVTEGTAPAEKSTEVFGAPVPETPEKDKRPAADSIERQVMAFFAYLDGRDYVQAAQLEGGTYAEYVRVVNDLSANLPKVAGETESLYAMLKNVSHFFRVLGKKRVQLAAEILLRENDILESAMHIFYLWYTSPGGKLQGRPSLETMYGYASYLLDTFGGRSYLMRRNSKTRLLTTYYCIRVIDRANDQNLNPNGVDIRPLIASILGEMRSQTGLIYRKSYVTELERLAQKYRL